jgi:RHS repeat-associated protein
MKDGVLSATYLYDANGNRLSKTTPSAAESATYDAQDRLLTYGQWAYGYTANGELLTKTNTTTGDLTTYSYDGMGNLRRVLLPDGRTIDYVVDSLNRRVAKKVNGTLIKRWLYRDLRKPVAELDGAGNVVSRFYYATNAKVPSYLVKGGVTYRVITNDIGTPKLVVNVATGAVAEAKELDEFGNTISDTAADFQPFGFAGGMYDPDTGLVRFGARDYDSVTGRWTAKDPLHFVASPNLYGYVGGDPINYTDPTGWTPKDKWYGHDNRDFQHWAHDQKKFSGDYTRDQLDRLQEEFDRLKNEGEKPGRPKSNKPKRGGGRKGGGDGDMCGGDSDPSMSGPDAPEPEPEPENAPSGPEPFSGPGPWNEDGSPVNPQGSIPVLPIIGPVGPIIAPSPVLIPAF